MTEAPTQLNEEQTLRHLANEKWKKEGNQLVSQDAFTPAATDQYLNSLSAATRDTLKLRVTPDKVDGPLSPAKRLVIDARAAQTYLKSNLTIVDGCEKSR